jgi:hypothetical protein
MMTMEHIEEGKYKIDKSKKGVRGRRQMTR